MTNPTPQVEECDRELADDIAKWSYSRLMGEKERTLYERTVEKFTPLLAAHRHSAVAAAVAKREAEIVEMILEYANIANERYVYDDLRKLCAMIQGKPLPKTNAELVQEQIGRSMDRPDKFPSID